MIPIRHRLTLKLALVIAVGITCVHAVFGYLRVVRESGRFRQEMTLDHQAIAHALRVAVVSTAIRSGPEAALDLIGDADLKTDRAQISWLESSNVDAMPRSVVGAAAQQHLHEPVETIVIVEDDEPYLRTTAVVVTPRLQGALRIEESMANEEKYIADTVSRTFLMTGIAIILSAAIVFAAGIHLVDGRLRPLLASVQRIGRGDFSTPVRLRGRDEMALLGDSLDQMAADLCELSEKNDREARRRIGAVQQLRHADRLATVGKMAAGVAHELGTPLNVVTARAKMIARGSSVGEEARDDARVIF